MARVEFERDEGYVVRRFRVTGALTPAEALRAEKLPKVGDPLSPKSPGLVAIKIDIEPCETMEQVVRGWWDVEVFYREWDNTIPEFSIKSLPLPLHHASFEYTVKDLEVQKRLQESYDRQRKHWEKALREREKTLDRAEAIEQKVIESFGQPYSGQVPYGYMTTPPSLTDVTVEGIEEAMIEAKKLLPPPEKAEDHEEKTAPEVKVNFRKFL